MNKSNELCSSKAVLWPEILILLTNLATLQLLYKWNKQRYFIDNSVWMSPCSDLTLVTRSICWLIIQYLFNQSSYIKSNYFELEIAGILWQIPSNAIEWTNDIGAYWTDSIPFRFQEGMSLRKKKVQLCWVASLIVDAGAGMKPSLKLSDRMKSPIHFKGSSKAWTA